MQSETGCCDMLASASEVAHVPHGAPSTRACRCSVLFAAGSLPISANMIILSNPC